MSSSTDKRDRSRFRRVEDAALAATENAQLANAAMALLACRTDEDVFQVVCDFMTGLVPRAVVAVSEVTPGIDFFITRRVCGAEETMFAKFAELVGFEPVGKRWPIPSAFRGQALSGTMSKVPGGFAAITSRDIPKPLAKLLTGTFGIADLYTVGIADGEKVLGNIGLITRDPDVAVPMHVIETFAHHCYSALAGIQRSRELIESAQRNALLIHSMVEGVALHEVLLDDDGAPRDFRFLDVNPAFEAMTGLKADEAIGRTMLEVRPLTDRDLIARYADVAATRIPARFEEYIKELDRYLEVVAYSPAPGQVASVCTDITDRRLADEELRASEERLSDLFEQAPLGYQSLDENGCFVEVNEAWLDLLGYERDEVMGKWFGDFLAAEFVEPFRERFPLFKARGAIHSEFQMMHKDGSRHAIAFEGRVGHNPDGTFKQTHCILSDITQRLAAERTLQDSEERYRTIAGTITSFVYSCQAEIGQPYRIDWMAGAVEDVTGYTADEIRERTCWRFMVLPEDLPIFDAGVIGLKPGRSARVEFRIVRRDGAIRWVRSTAQAASAAGLDAPHRLFGGCEDITERKTGEASLQASHDVLVHVTDMVPGVVYQYQLWPDGHSAFPFASRGMIDIYEYPPEEVREDATPVFGRLHPEDYDDVAADIAESARTLEPFHSEFRVVLPRQGLRWRLSDALPQRMEDGSTLWYGIISDVTDRVQTEAALRASEARIERTLTSVIDIASTIVETRDPYTAGHQRRVSEIATRIARDLGMSEAEIADIKVAALIHDVGKVQIPAEILGKPGAISALEYEILKGHAEAGYRIVSSAKMDEPIAEMVYQHHERIDGSGYPRGLRGDETPFGAKVLAVADVVEAMMSHRPYRPALGIEAALAEIERGAGHVYDMEIATTCVTLFREKGFVLA